VVDLRADAWPLGPRRNRGADAARSQGRAHRRPRLQRSSCKSRRRRTSAPRTGCRLRIFSCEPRKLFGSHTNRTAIISLVVGWVMSGCIGRQACRERAVPAAMR
jgi:hypothetical protein